MTEARLHHEVRGRDDAPTMMLLHGFLSSNVQWERNVEALGEHLRLVLVEMPGHGDSPTPDDPAGYTLDAIIAALDGIRRSVGVDRWWVCGQSLGAAMTLNYVLAHQDDVHGVVVTNTRAAFGVSRSDPDVDYRTIDLRSVPFHPIHAKRFPPEIKQRMVERADAIPPHVLNHVIAERDRWYVVDRLGELQVPMMLVNGRFERVFQPFVDDVRAASSAVEIVHLDGGHSINVEQPHAFNAAVLDFVERHSAPAP